MRRRTLAVLLAGTALVAGGLSAALSAAQASSSTSAAVRGSFLQGGAARLQVETGNVRPVVCFSFDSPLPADGDSIRADVRRAGSLELVQELGTGHQWVHGSAAGCEVPQDRSALDALLAAPQDYVATFEVVETQGNPPLPGVFATAPLRRA